MNQVLTFRRNHPGNRCSYGIAGNSGIVVFDRGLVAGTVPTTSNEDLGGMPATINVDVELVEPKADNGKQAKDEARAAKLKEKADKAAAKIEAAKAKAEERAKKAQEKLDAAQAKIEAAKAKASETPAAE